MHDIELFHVLTALLTAITITLIIMYLQKEFGEHVIWITLLCIVLTMPYLVSIARNLYWVPFTLLLPFLIMLYITSSEKYFNKKGFSLTGLLLIFISIFIKCASGYEFLSTILIAGSVPLFYDSIKKNIDKKTFFNRFIQYSVVSMLGFLSCLVIHTLQKALYFGSFRESIYQLTYNVAKRTHGLGVEIIEGSLVESLDATVLSVIITYLKSPVLLLIIILVTVTIILLKDLIIEKRQLKNLNEVPKDNMVLTDRTLLAGVCSSWVAFLAPLSWYILAKGHSYFHTPINYILWNIPFTFLTIAVCSYFIINNIVRRNNKIKILAIFILISCLLITNLYGQFKFGD